MDERNQPRRRWPYIAAGLAAAWMLLAPFWSDITVAGPGVGAQVRFWRVTKNFNALKVQPGIELGTDPWGGEYGYALSPAPHGTVTSPGPNGLDENGRGDDIRFLYAASGEHVLLAYFPESLLVLALLLTWCKVGPGARANHAQKRATELRRVAILALVPASAGGLLLFFLLIMRGGPGLFSFLPAHLTVPMSFALLCALAASWVRLNAPHEERVGEESGAM